MRIRGLDRFWRRLGAYAALAIAVSLAAAADTTTSTTTSSKKTPTSHPSATHATSSHTTNSQTKSETTKSHSTTSTAHATSKRTTAHSSHGKKTTKSSKKRGQQAIDSDRARQIQEALIREHYLSGEPSGSWDNTTQAAMQRYQADQGWQNKTTPDSRALIKLGLGPSNDHLLNPDSAMTSSTMTSSAMRSNAIATGTAATTAVDPNSKTAPRLPESNSRPATDSNPVPVPDQQPNR
jgi:hypothetical protein